jgi:hypothetical protein
MGNLVNQTLYPPPLFGRFHQVRDRELNYPIAATIMACVEGDNWKQESFTDLYDKDMLWAFAMMSYKRMGLQMAQRSMITVRVDSPHRAISTALNHTGK